MNLIQRLKEISDGWYNDAFPTPEVLKFAEPRATTCAGCVLNVNNVCTTKVEAEAVKDFNYHEEQRYKGKLYKGCGCPLSKKTKSPGSICPLGKWEAVTTDINK